MNNSIAKKFNELKINTNLIFAFFAILAIIMSPMRIYADSAYYLAHVIRTHNFWVEHLRIVIFPDELFIRIGVFFQFPMLLLLLIYSLTPVIWFFMLFKISKWISKSDKNYIKKQVYWDGIWIGTLFIGFTHGFFCPHFEGYYAMAFGIFALQIASLQINFLRISLFLISFTFCIFGYPHAALVIILLFSIQNYDKNETIIQNIKNNKEYLIAILFLVLINFIIKKNYVSEYEKGKIQQFINNILNFKISQIKDAFIPIFTFCLEFTFTSFFILYSNFKINKLKAIFIALSLFFLTFLLYFTNPNPGWGRYNEQVYFPLCVFICVFLFENLNNNIKYSKIFLVTIIAFWIIKISIVSSQMIERQQIMHQFIQLAQNQNGNKFILSQSEIDKNINTNTNWSYSIETFIISQAFYNKSVTIIPEEDFNITSKPTKDEFIFRINEKFILKDCNPNYYNLKNEDYNLLNIK